MPEPVLRIEGLACQRGDRLLWRGINASLSPGEVLHVIGANGTGKSSLLRVVAGLLPAAAGRVAAAPLGLVDEAHALDRDRPLTAALAFWVRIDGRPASAIAPALDRLGIAHLADVPVRFFSTGQRRRAALARLLVSEARLWLLDEPANGLDRDGVALLEALIAGHRASGGAVLLASHQPLALDALATLDLAEYGA